MKKYPPQIQRLISQARKLKIKYQLIHQDKNYFYSKLSYGSKYIFIRNSDLWRNVNKMSSVLLSNSIVLNKVLKKNILSGYSRKNNHYFSLLILDHRVIGYRENGLSINKEFEKIAKKITRELNLNLAEISFDKKGIIDINKGENYNFYGPEITIQLLKKIFSIKN